MAYKIIQVIRKGILDPSFYGQTFVTLNTFQGVSDYGLFEQGSYCFKKHNKTNERKAKIERDILMELGVHDVMVSSSSSGGDRAVELNSMTKDGTTLHYHDPGDFSVAYKMRSIHGDSIRQILTFHCPPEGGRNKMSKLYKPRGSRSLPTFDGFVAVSDYVAKQLVLQGVPREKINKVYNGINTDLYNIAMTEEQELLREKLDISPDENVFSFVGRLGFRKGMEIVKGMISRYKEWPADSTFVIASPSQNETRQVMNFVEEVSPELIKKGKIKFTIDMSKYSHLVSPVTNNEVRKFLESHFSKLGFSKSPAYAGIVEFPVAKISDVGIFPTYWEALGLVPLEFIACGTPVIGSSVGGTAEILEMHQYSAQVPLSSLITKVSKNDLETLEEYKKEMREVELDMIVSRYIRLLHRKFEEKGTLDRETAVAGRQAIIDNQLSLDQMTARLMNLYSS